jgi:hypothetical protein
MNQIIGLTSASGIRLGLKPWESTILSIANKWHANQVCERNVKEITEQFVAQFLRFVVNKRGILGWPPCVEYIPNETIVPVTTVHECLVSILASYSCIHVHSVEVKAEVVYEVRCSFDLQFSTLPDVVKAVNNHILHELKGVSFVYAM